MFWIIGGKLLVLSLSATVLQTKVAPEWISAQLQHTHWVGFTSYDLIMALFLFIVGAAMPFSYSKYIGPGRPRAAVYRRMASRFVMLWLLGMMYQGNLLKLDWAILRPFTNVLQTIAFGYAATGLILLHVPRRWHGLVTAGLLIGYWLAMAFIPVPGIGTGRYEEDLNLAVWIDTQILGSHRYDNIVNGVHSTHYAFILPILNFTAMVMLGMHAGQLLKSSLAPVRKLLWLIGAGVAALVLGWLWSFSFPIIKPLFTSSMVLWAGGWCCLLLALFYGIIDVLRWRAWSFPFMVIGSNALFAYMTSHLFGDQLMGMSRVLTGGVARLCDTFGWGGAVTALGFFLFQWLILWFLYRNKLFWRV